MSRIVIHSLSKSYAGRDLFQDFSLEIAAGSRVAVVGPNGAGKSTLIKLIAGETSPDGGQVVMPKGTRLGYVAQELAPEDLAKRLLTFVLEVLPSWAEFWEEWEAAAASGDEIRIKRLAERQSALEATYGYNPEHRARAILHGLGFSDGALLSPVSALSGGWRERAKLARVLVAGADVLLLDEPTNHLDLEAVRWLEQYLLAYEGVLVFVAHDRVFIENVATHVLFLGGSKPMFRKGGFQDFLAWQAETAADRERRADKISAEIAHLMSFVSRFKAKATKAKQAQSRMKQVERLKAGLADLAPEKKARSLSFRLPQPKKSDKTVLSVVDLAFRFPGKPELWPPLSFNIYRGQKIALAGANGSGKSTLLKLLVGVLSPDSGTIQFGSSVSLGYFSQHQTDVLSLSGTVLGELRRLADPRTTEEELRSVLGLFMLGEKYWDRPVSALSGGEKNRLALSSLFLTRANFLVLDEPTNHLDLESREALVAALRDYEGTMLVVAHDRNLLSEAAEELWALSGQGLEVFAGGYEEYERCRLEEVRPGKSDPTCSPKPPPAQQDKEAKRRQAELRNAVYRELKPKKEAYAKLEAELDRVLAETTAIEERLADPATYGGGVDVGALNEAHARLRREGEELMERLMVLEEEILELEARKSGAEDA